MFANYLHITSSCLDNVKLSHNTQFTLSAAEENSLLAPQERIPL